MKSGLLAVIAGAVTMLVLAAPAHATDLYTNDLENDIPGPGFLAGWYDYSGTGSAGETLTVTPEITASGGVGGTQSFHVGLDWSTVDMSTYWYFGMGTYAVYASDVDPIALGVEGTEDPGRYQVTVDIKVEGNTFYNAEDPEVIDYVNTMPLTLTVANYNDVYDTETGTDGNGDGEVNGANVYVSTFSPTLEDMGDYVTATFRLHQGMVSADGSLTPTFDNTSPLYLSLNTSTGGFGMDTGNSLSLDNIKIEFLDVVPALDGDYNGNDVIDAADYAVWRDALTAGATSLLNDPTPGTVDESDFDYWRAHFGETLGSGAGSGSAAVPEPTSLSLVSVLAMCLLGARLPRRLAAAPIDV